MHFGYEEALCSAWKILCAETCELNLMNTELHTERKNYMSLIEFLEPVKTGIWEKHQSHLFGSKSRYF